MRKQSLWIVAGLICIILLGYLCLADVIRESDLNLDQEASAPNTASILPASFSQGGIFEAFQEKAYEQLERMSLDEKVGQMILGRCPKESAVADLQKYHLGGFVLFGKDFSGKTKEQIKKTLADYQTAAQIPLILSTDEEGGAIVRASSNSLLAERPFRSPQDLYKEGGMDLTRSDSESKAIFLKELGVNVNFAPVADVSENKSDYIYSRTLGRSATETSEYVKNAVEGLQGQGVGAVLKHFPGYGNNRDTHSESSVDKRSIEQFRAVDFLPFQAGIDAGAYSVLVSHNIVNCMDDTLPASLSPAVHNVLRTELGFTGVILTDDLHMEAITEHITDMSPAVKAVLAGNDMIITTDYAESYTSILKAVSDGVISEEMIDNAAYHVLEWKYALGLLGQ